MPTMPKSLFWTRTDTAGSEHVLFSDGGGLTARGVSQAVDPIPYTCRYQLRTAPDGATERLDVEAEGANWARGVRLERTADRWRVTTSEQGDLDAVLRVTGHPPAGLPGTDDPDRLVGALDVDLSGSPLFNTLPVRRLGLLTANPGTAHGLVVAWVLLPSLAVLPAEQTYTALGANRIGFASGAFSTEVELDDAGYVVHYPGLATRAEGR